MRTKKLQSAQHDFLLRDGVLIALLILFIIIVLKSAWISNDAYITFRIVENFVHGYGLVWNAGERVQAYTHPLWMFLLSAMRWGTGELYYSVYALSIGLTIGALLLFAKRISRSVSGVAIGITILLCAKSFVDYTTSGLENPLNHFLLALFYAIFFSPLGQSTPQLEQAKVDAPHSFMRPLLLAFIAALGGLARIDLLILFLPGLLYELWCARRFQTVLAMGVGFLPLILWEAFSLLYYGFPFPNTAYAKLNAGIEKSHFVKQGIFYLLRSVDLDALTMVVIGCGLLLPIMLKQMRTSMVSISIGLYLVYIVWIGGDFMAGRFLSAPLLCAIFALSQMPLPTFNQTSSYVIIGSVVGLSLLNPSTSPLLTTDVYETEPDDNQVEDMRAHHLYHTDLLNATVDNRLYEQGHIKGERPIGLYTHCVGMGPGEYFGGAHPYIVDVCALTDPLLARIPAIYTTDLFAGHYFRVLPDGYLQTLRLGQNRIDDPQLAQYFDKLSLITKGDLWDRKRLSTIWQMNIGRYDHLIDFNRYRYPNVAVVADKSMSRTQDGKAKTLEGYVRQHKEIGTTGWLLTFDEPIHADFIDLGWDEDYFQATYALGDEAILQQIIGLRPMPIDGQQVTMVAIPNSVKIQGFDSVRFLPLRPGSSLLNYVDLIALPPAKGLAGKSASNDLSALDVSKEMDQSNFEQLMRLYNFVWLRYLEPERSRILTSIYSQIEESPPEVWQALPSSLRLSLLNKPDPVIQEQLNEAISQIVLIDKAGKPLLTFWGASSESTDGVKARRRMKENDSGSEDHQDSIESSADSDEEVLHLHLYFEVLSNLDKDYSAWVNLKSTTTGAEWMLYDRFPQRDMKEWTSGEIIDFHIPLFMQPDTYTITAGLWTPIVRERLYVERGNSDEVYWLDLGEHTVKVH